MPHALDNRGPEMTASALARLLGPIPLSRIRTNPLPGTATEEDVVRIREREGRLYELTRGVLVEKAMGFEESAVAATLIALLYNFLSEHNLGCVTGEGGMVKLDFGLIRIPDVAFTSWERLRAVKGPKEPVPLLAPDLAVEVLSRGNTKKEIDLKVAEFFAAGVRLVWIVDPRKRTVRALTAPGAATLLREADALDGGDVLPGFAVAVREIFAQADRIPPDLRDA